MLFFSYLISLLIILTFVYLITKLWLTFRNKLITNINYVPILSLAFLFALISSNHFLANILIEEKDKLPLIDQYNVIYLIGIITFSITAIIIISFINNKVDIELSINKDTMVIDKIVHDSEEDISSPHLHIRIQELFELKFEKDGLILEYNSEEKLLFG